MNIFALSNVCTQRVASVSLISVMATLTMTACGESKTAQCEKLIEVINKGEEIDKKFEAETASLANFEKAESFEDFKTAAGDMSTAFDTIAGDVEGYITEVEALELSDEELLGYQETYVTEGNTFSELIREASGLFDEVSGLEATPEGSERLMELATSFNDFSVKVDESSQNIDGIINDINDYCGVTPEANTEGEGAGVEEGTSGESSPTEGGEGN